MVCGEGGRLESVVFGLCGEGGRLRSVVIGVWCSLGRAVSRRIDLLRV